MIFLLDWFDANNNRKPYSQVIKMAGSLHCKLPRLIHVGAPVAPDKLIKQYDALKSNITNEQAEGMVYRVEREGKFDFRAKWVRDDFEAGKLLKGRNV